MNEVVDAKEVGRRLIELRGTKTQEKVAADIGTSVSAIGMYERGERIPRDEIKVKIANYFAVSIQELFYAQKCHET